RKTKAPGKSLCAGAKNSREQDWLRTAWRDLGNTTGRTSRRLALVDGNFRDPRRYGSTARTEDPNRKVPEREESEDERSFDADQLGLQAGRVPQETGIPGDVTSFVEVTRLNLSRTPPSSSQRSAQSRSRLERTRSAGEGRVGTPRLSSRAKSEGYRRTALRSRRGIPRLPYASLGMAV